MPDLIRLYIRHTLIGFAVSAAFVAMLFYFNVANLWHLVTHDPAGWLAAFLLVMFNGIVFSGVQFGFAVMRMADTDDSGDRGARPKNPLPGLAAVPVVARDPRRP